MDNKLTKYFNISEGNWHQNKIGTYHVSAIGNSHQDLEPEEHYGPCLRATATQYTQPPDKTLHFLGTVHIGKLIHRIIQENFKEKNPNAKIEYPIIIKKDGLIFKGSVDILIREPDMVIDIKTANRFTFPSGKYDYNPTYVSQLKIYAGFLIRILENFNPEKVRIVYVEKSSLKTIEIDVSVSKEELEDAIKDFEERAKYLHECLTQDKFVIAEPHKWCKYCPLLKSVCIPRGDIEIVKKGRKTRYLKT